MVRDRMCVPCNKAADWNHLNSSKRHTQVQETIAGCNYMCGPSTQRQYAEGLKLPRGNPQTGGLQL